MKLALPWRRGGTAHCVGLTVRGEETALASLRPKPGGEPGFGGIELGTGPFSDELLTDLVARQRVAGAACVLTLEPGAYSLFQVDRPALRGEELRAAMRWKIKDLVDYPPDEAVLDVFDVPPRAQGADSGTVYVAVARAADVRPRVEAIDAARLRLKRIDIAELSLRNLAERLAPGGEPVAILHFHRDRGMIAIARQGTLYLARALSVGFDALAGVLPPADGDEPSVDLESVALEVQRTTDYYDSYFGQSPVRRFRIMPGLPSLEGLADHLAGTLAVDARLATLDDVVAGAGDVADASALATGSLALGGALGHGEAG